MDFNNTTTLFGAAAIGSLVAFWGQLRTWISNVFTIFIRSDFVDFQMSERLTRHLLDQSKIIRYGSSKYAAPQKALIKKINEECESLVYTRHECQLNLLFKNKTPIRLTNEESGLKVTYLWGTFNFKKEFEQAYLKMCEDRFSDTNGTKMSNFKVFMWGGKDPSFTKNGNSDPQSETQPPSSRNSNPFDNNYDSGPAFSRMALGNKLDVVGGIKYDDIIWNYRETKLDHRYYWSKGATKLLDEVRFFEEKRGWFTKKDIPHFRGCLLRGVPGAGKSLAVRKIAEKLGIPVHRFDISNMSNEEFTRFWDTTPSQTTISIILIEDIDAVFQGRTNILAENSLNKPLLTFDVLINTINGVQIQTGAGTFLVITTNHPEALDPALTRAGRCDLDIELGPLEAEGRRHIATNILKEWPVLQEQIINDQSVVTAAEFESKCICMAREEMYKK